MLIQRIHHSKQIISRDKHYTSLPSPGDLGKSRKVDYIMENTSELSFEQYRELILRKASYILDT